MEYYSIVRKNEIVPFAEIIDGPRDCHTEWSKSEKENQILYINMYVGSRKLVQMNLFAKQK